MFRVGLTGGIASGKSEVAKIWQANGVELIDLDALSRQVLATPKVQAEVRAHFGSHVFTPQGLSRSKLAETVFNDAAKLRILESIIHKRVNKKVAEIELELLNAGGKMVVHDSPLLLEKQLEDSYQFIVLVEAETQARVHRILTQRGKSEEYAYSVINNQLTSAERLARLKNHPHLVIENNSDLANLKAQALKALAQIYTHLP